MIQPLDADVERLGRASQTAARITFLGFLLIGVTLAYAFAALERLERQRLDLQAQTRELIAQRNKYKSDIEHLQHQLSLSRSALASGRAAINAFHSGNFDLALRFYDEALTYDPDNAYILNLRAYTLFRLGRLQDAIAGERQSITIDPAYAWGYLDLARFLCASSPPNMEDAKRAASRAVELRPDLSDVIEQDGEFQRVCHRQIHGH